MRGEQRGRHREAEEGFAAGSGGFRGGQVAGSVETVCEQEGKQEDAAGAHAAQHVCGFRLLLEIAAGHFCAGQQLAQTPAEQLRLRRRFRELGTVGNHQDAGVLLQQRTNGLCGGLRQPGGGPQHGLVIELRFFSPRGIGALQGGGEALAAAAAAEHEHGVYQNGGIRGRQRGGGQVAQMAAVDAGTRHADAGRVERESLFIVAHQQVIALPAAVAQVEEDDYAQYRRL